MYSKPFCSSSMVLLLALFVAGNVLGFTAGVDRDLVGWWKFDETQGDALDSSNNGNPGLIQGSAVRVPGVFGGALQFDGTSAYVNCGNSSLLQFRNQITLACWLKTPGFTRGWAGIITKGDVAWRLSRSGENGDSIHLGLNGVTTANNEPWFSASKLVTDNQWHHVAGTYDGAQGRIYIDGVLCASLAATGQINTTTSNVFVGENEGATGRYFYGTLDDVRIYKRGLTAEEVQIIMKGYVGPVAEDPVPANQATDAARDALLSWTAGRAAQMHDVYFGTVFADVNTASRSDPKGVLVSQDQTNTTYDPAGLLTFGQTYYWRVDEVNYAPSLMIYRGPVWTFTAETYTYAVKPIKTTASSSSTSSMGPEKTIDDSGLNTQDQHSTMSTAMWLSKSTPAPAWIKYEFAGPCKLQEMWVWNSNQSKEPYMGYGARTVTIETSLDDTTWTPLAGVPEFTRAPGKDGYAHNTTVNFGLIMAKYVRLTITKAWSGGAQAGLSEVRFYGVPLAAFGPDPADGAKDVTVDNVLTWRPGREAVRHDLYFSKDAKVVTDGTGLVGTLTDHSYAPSLDLEQTYYWKVNEVNEAATTRIWEGPVWSFTTASRIVIDDMESYSDQPGEQVFFSWIDGWGTTTNGSQVGNTNAPFCEWVIVHGGGQSMPLAYTNTGSSMTAEATRTFESTQDWTRSGVKNLLLCYYGVEVNPTTVPFWVQVNDQSGRSARVILGSSAGEDPATLASPAWTEWKIALSRFSGSDLSKVKSMTIGIGPGAAIGKLYIDDIRLIK